MADNKLIPLQSTHFRWIHRSLGDCLIQNGVYTIRKWRKVGSLYSFNFLDSQGYEREWSLQSFLTTRIKDCSFSSMLKEVLK